MNNNVEVSSDGFKSMIGRCRISDLGTEFWLSQKMHCMNADLGFTVLNIHPECHSKSEYIFEGKVYGCCSSRIGIHIGGGRESFIFRS